MDAQRKTAAGKAAETPGDIAPATSFNPAGAAREEVPVSADHPALDANQRGGANAIQNRIDLNDPTKSGHEAVADALKAQQV